MPTAWRAMPRNRRLSAAAYDLVEPSLGKWIYPLLVVTGGIVLLGLAVLVD